MKIDSLRSSLAAPFAAIFLILLLCVFGTTKRPPALGLSVPVGNVRTFPFKDCYDDRSVWVLLLQDGSTLINETRVPRSELKLRISEIYANREEPNAAFMRVDPEVPYADFVDAYSEVVSAHHGLRVGVITDDLKRRLEACPRGVGSTDPRKRVVCRQSGSYPGSTVVPLVVSGLPVIRDLGT